MNPISLVKSNPLQTIRSTYHQTDINSALPNEEWNALTYFTAENDAPSVNKLLLSGAHSGLSGSNGPLKSLTGSGHTPLHVAARYGSVDCMEQLVRGRVRAARREAGNDMTESIVVAGGGANGREGNVGCDVNERDRFGFAPLHYAACSGYTDGVEALLRLGADGMAKGGASGKLMPADVAKLRGHLGENGLMR